MAKVTVKFESKRLIQRAHTAFNLANDDLEQAIIGEIASPVWSWPGQTVRRSGEVAGSPRNIIDEGTLLDSYRVEKRGKTVCSHVFEAEHALIVHEGAQLRNGGTIAPRPFTERPREAFPEMFARRFKQAQ